MFKGAETELKRHLFFSSAQTLQLRWVDLLTKDTRPPFDSYKILSWSKIYFQQGSPNEKNIQTNQPRKQSKLTKNEPIGENIKILKEGD